MHRYIPVIILLLLTTSLAGCIEDSSDSDDDNEKDYRISADIYSPTEDSIVGRDFRVTGTFSALAEAYEDPELRLKLFLDEKMVAEIPKDMQDPDWSVGVSAKGFADGPLAIVLKVIHGEEALVESSVGVELDTTPPEVELQDPGRLVREFVVLKVVGEGLADVAFVHFLVDGELARNTTGTSFQWDTTGEEDGAHETSAEATDAAGNVKICPSIFATVDNTPPSAAIESPAGGALLSGTVTVEIDSSDRYGLLLRELYVDGSLEHSGSGDYYWDSTAFFDGQHSLEFNVVDKAGNQADHRIMVSVDNTPPEVSFRSPKDSGTVSSVVTLRADVTDEHEITEISFGIDGDELPGSGSDTCDLDTSLYSDGEHTLTVEAWDRAGNHAMASIHVTINNNEPPAAVISSPGDGSEYQNDEMLHFDGSDSSDPDGDELSCAWESDLDGELSRDLVFDSGLSVGQHEITLTVEDPSGESDSTSVDITVSRGNEPPVARISSPSDGSEFEEDETIPFDGTDSSDPEGDGIIYLWESDRDGTLSSEESFETVLSTGEHIITLTVEDHPGGGGEETGKTDSTSIKVVVNPHGNEIPEVTITSPQDEAKVWDTITVEGMADDPEDDLESLEFRIDDGDWTGIAVEEEWSFSLDTTEYEDGTHSIDVRVRDGAGSEGTDSIRVDVKNQGPVIEITEPANNSYLSWTVDILTETESESDIEHITFAINHEDRQQSTNTPGTHMT